jgi:hypothetical protein
MAKVLKNHAMAMVDPKSSMSDRVWSGLTLGQFLVIPYALQELAAARLSPEDRKEWQKTIKLSPDYVRGQINIPIARDKKTGVFSKINLGPLIPAGDFVAMVQAALKGDAGALAASNPIIGTGKTPLLTAASSIMQGEDMFNKRPIEDAGDAFMTIARTFAPPDMPYIGSRSEKYSRAFTKNEEGGLGVTDFRTGRVDTPATAIGSTLGATVSRINPTVVASSIKLDFEKKKENLVSEVKRSLSTNASDEEKKKATDKFNRRLMRVVDQTEKKLKILNE